MKDYRNTLHKWVAHIGDVDTSELAADHVRRYLYHLRIEEELAPKTVKNAWIGLSAFFTWLEGEMGIEHVIRRYKIKMPAAQSREIIPMSKVDLRGLLLACERTAVWKSDKRAPATTLRATASPRSGHRACTARHGHARRQNCARWKFVMLI